MICITPNSTDIQHGNFNSENQSRGFCGYNIKNKMEINNTVLVAEVAQSV